MYYRIEEYVDQKQQEILRYNSNVLIPDKMNKKDKDVPVWITVALTVNGLRQRPSATHVKS